MLKRGSRIAMGAWVSAAFVTAASAQTTIRLSVASGGAQSNGASDYPAASADARFVAFESDATNLVAGDTNGVADIFMYDRLLGVTRRISETSAGVEGDQRSEGPAAIAANGQHVAFHSLATNLVPGDTNGQRDVFVRRVFGGTITRVSVSSAGGQATGASSIGGISANGRHIAFTSGAPDLVPGDTNDAQDAFVHDQQTGVTERVSVSSAGAEGLNGGAALAISEDGRFVAFGSSSLNLVPGDTNGASDIFVRDRLLGTTERVSVSSLGAEADAHCGGGAMTPDGRFVVFHTTATTLVPADTNAKEDIFVHDRATHETTRVSLASSGAQSNGNSQSASISGDGRYVAFDSFASNLDPLDTDTRRDTFVHDRVTGGTALINLGWDGARGNHASFFPSVSSDGFFVAFKARASNLVPGDTNGADDIFLRNLQPVIPASPYPAGDQPAALAIADFDGDDLHRPDLAVVNAGSNNVTLLFNNGTPGAGPSFAPPSAPFTFAVGARPLGVAGADIDGDGDPDLAVASSIGDSISILRNDGTGSFTDAPAISAPGSPRSVALTDLDGDGLPDLVVTRHDAGLISVFRNIGGGMFAPDQPQQVPPNGGNPSGPSGVGEGDLDNDKDVDVVACLDLAGAILVFPNTSPAPGTISFGPAQAFAVGGVEPRPVSVALRDLDFDGFLDAACANKGTNSVSIFRNLGVDGGNAWLGFAPPVSFPVGTLPVSVGADDIYGFGLSDLFTANAFVDPTNESSVSLLKNVSVPGAIAFEPEVRVAVPPLAAHVASKDVNLDNRVDIAVATGFDAGSLTDGTGSAGSASSGAQRRAGRPSHGDGVVGSAAVLAGASPSVVLAPCDGDANGDRVVDFLDLNIVLGFYGQTGPALPGDLNADGVVDFLDLNIVLSAFGSTC